MQLIIDIAVLILKILIKIGDFVISLSSIIAKLGKEITYPYLPSRRRTSKRAEVHPIYPAKPSLSRNLLITTSRLLKKGLNAGIKTILHILSISKKLFGKIVSIPKNFVSKLHLKQKKKKQKNQLKPIAYPSFFSKFRYFLSGAFFSCIAIFFPLLLMLFLQDLPNPNELSLRHIPQTTKIYDRNGVLLYQIYASQNRTLVPLSRIPNHLKNATIAVEDKDFYNHPGFDTKAILRSIIENFSGNGLQGGSTITQQLIKSALLTPETSIQRKVKEIVLAFWAERVYSKEQILEMYFNQVPFGGTAWGVEAASEVYFGKKVEDLTLSETAFLAGIPKAPTLYSPFGESPSAWKTRQKEVLNRMVKLKYISKKEEKEALSQALSFQIPQTPLHAPYFVMYIKDLLAKKYGLSTVERGGLSVITSLDLKLNNIVQAVVAEEVEKYAYLHLTNGAALVTNPKNGDILAMIGGKDYSHEESGNVNVTTSLRQPGSSIKVVTYAASLTRGFTAATILDDSPITYKIPGTSAYTPVNYDKAYHGKIPLRIALANSYNIPAVKTLSAIGVPTMLQVGKEMGIKSWNDDSRYGLSLTLGGGEVTMLDMATVYSTLANRGERVDLNPILKITDSKGSVLEEKKDVQKKSVLDEGIAFIISDILADNKARSWEFGSNSLLSIPGYTVSVKTGTSDNKRDNWMIGYTPSFVATVWVGNNDNTPMSQYLASGITGAAPIWNRIMTTLLNGTKDEKQQPPHNIVRKPCQGRMEYFLIGTELTAPCRSFALPLTSPTPNP